MINYFGIIKPIILAVIFVLIPLKSNSQEKKIDFNAENMEYDKSIANGAFRLKDNVVFFHEGAKMYCDSAYFYSDENSLDAFSNVYINQADTIHLYGDYLHYDGHTRLSQIQRNVRLVSKETNLTTSVLDFDLKNNIGYYTTGARILNGENKLRSRLGYYYSNEHLYYFKDSVVVENPDYTIYCDTLKYNTQTNTAFFLGPTEIISDSNYVYCERGWHNTETNISVLKKNALLKNKQQTVKGDSLYYDRNTGNGKAFGSVEMIDLEQDVILKGDYATYKEKTENSLLTGHAEFIQITDKDSIYVHADTLRSEQDTSGARLLRAYYKVKLFKSDMQGKCDSMSYSFADSVIRLYDDPVLWFEENQLTAASIEILTKNRKVDKLKMQQLAFIVSQVDTSSYNQIKGKDMLCYFKDNELYRIDVSGNGQTVYYPEDQGEIIGVNKAESSDLVIYVVDGKVKTIKFINQPKAVLYPLGEISESDKKLKDFRWLDSHRPRKKEDIFIWTQ